MERIHYAEAVHGFTTPGGNAAKMHYRKDTNDWNTINASMVEDEYYIKGLPLLTGLAVDIGAYVGSVGIALALDNPALKVVCVEPVPENVELIWRNIKENGLEGRVDVLQAGAAAPGTDRTTVRWRYRGSPTADHHAFVGNISLIEGTGATGVDFEEEEVECASISGLAARYGPICFLKIDCEGCEWSALNDPAVEGIPLIVGEWHPTCGKTKSDLFALLGKTHILSFEGLDAGPGAFRAVVRFFRKNGL